MYLGIEELRDLCDKQAEGFERICLHLDGGDRGNWEALGKKLEIPGNKLQQFAKSYSCSEEVFEIIKAKAYPEVTVGRVKDVLKQIERVDVCRPLSSLPGKSK